MEKAAEPKRSRAKTEGGTKAKGNRKRKKLIKQVFYIEAQYKSLEDLLDGRQNILACIEEAAKAGDSC